MVTCNGCGGEFEAAALEHHHRGGIHYVHCPECDCHLGTYNER